MAPAPLGKVSVVMMARAAASIPSARSPATSSVHASQDLLDRQPLADHAGGRHEHLARRAAQGRRHRLGLGAHGGIALRAAKHVGAAGIDDHRARPPSAQDLPAPEHRMAGRGRAGEHGCDRAAVGDLDQGQIVAVAVADPGVERGEARARAPRAGRESRPGPAASGA